MELPTGMPRPSRKDLGALWGSIKRRLASRSFAYQRETTPGGSAYSTASKVEAFGRALRGGDSRGKSLERDSENELLYGNYLVTGLLLGRTFTESRVGGSFD